jgi:hypothetical protein
MKNSPALDSKKGRNRFSILITDTILLLGLLAVIAYAFGWTTGTVAPPDQIFLNTEGVVFFNDVAVERFDEDRVEYSSTTDLAGRLHKIFRKRAASPMVWLSVEGETLVGWNNRLVDVVYGIVEYELASWEHFVYQVNNEAGTEVEVGLHDLAMQVSAELIFKGRVRIEVDRLKKRTTGLCMVVLGGDNWTVMEARSQARPIFGDQLQVGFEQRLEATSIDDSEGFPELGERCSTRLRLFENGDVWLNDDRFARFGSNFQPGDEPSQPVKKFREWAREKSVHQILFEVDGLAKYSWYSSLWSARELPYDGGMTIFHPGFAKIDDGIIHPVHRHLLHSTKLNLNFLPDGEPNLTVEGGTLDLEQWDLYSPRLVFGLKGLPPGTVNEVRKMVKGVFGSNAEVGPTALVGSFTQDLQVAARQNPVSNSRVGTDRIQLLADGTVKLNTEIVAQFEPAKAWYKETEDVGKLIHERLIEKADVNLVELTVSENACVGWNNRLIHVIYGLVEYELVPWKSFRYRVGGEKSTAVPIGLYKTTRQITAEFLPADELPEDGYQPFLYLEPAEAELPMGGRSTDQGFSMVAIGGGATPLHEARTQLRRLFGPDAQIGFEQRAQVVPTPLTAEAEALKDDQWDDLFLYKFGTVHLNYSKVAKYPLKFQHSSDLRDTNSEIRNALSQIEAGRGLRIRVEADTHVHCLNGVMEAAFTDNVENEMKWAAITYQVDNHSQVNVPSEIYFTARHLSAYPGLHGEPRMELGPPLQGYLGGVREDIGMCTRTRISRSRTVGEMRVFVQSIFGPHAEFGFSQRFQVVAEDQ